MTEPAGADASTAIGVWRDVENDVIGTRGIAGDSAHSGQMIQSQVLAHTPGDVVVRAGSISTHSDSTHNLLARPIQREPSTEHVHAADLIALHRVLRRERVRWRARA